MLELRPRSLLVRGVSTQEDPGRHCVVRRLDTRAFPSTVPLVDQELGRVADLGTVVPIELDAGAQQSITAQLEVERQLVAFALFDPCTLRAVRQEHVLALGVVHLHPVAILVDAGITTTGVPPRDSCSRHVVQRRHRIVGAQRRSPHFESIPVRGTTTQTVHLPERRGTLRPVGQTSLERRVHQFVAAHRVRQLQRPVRTRMDHRQFVSVTPLGFRDGVQSFSHPFGANTEQAQRLSGIGHRQDLVVDLQVGDMLRGGREVQSRHALRNEEPHLLQREHGSVGPGCHQHPEAHTVVQLPHGEQHRLHVVVKVERLERSDQRQVERHAGHSIVQRIDVRGVQVRHVAHPGPHTQTLVPGDNHVLHLPARGWC